MPALIDPQREAFAQHYALNGHAGKAAEAIGLERAHGHKQLRHPEVADRIRELNELQFAHVGVTAETVKGELARIAFASGRDLFNAHGQMIPISELTDDVASTITGIDVERRKGEGGETYEILKIRRADKLGALALLARHFKVVGGEDDGVNALANVLADKLNEAKARRLANLNQDTEDARIIPQRQVTDGRSATLDADAVEVLFEQPEVVPVQSPPASTPENDDEERLW